MKEKNKILLISIVISAIITCFIAVSILLITAQYPNPETETMMMHKIIEGSMPGAKFFPLDVLTVVSVLLFVSLSMIFYVILKYKMEKKK